MRCPGCGAEVNSRFCTYCGRELPRDNAQNVAGDNSQQTIINNYYYGQQPVSRTQPQQPQPQPQSYYQYNYTTNINEVSGKDRIVTLLLCFFFGFLGVHYFYVGRWGMGLVYFFTGAFCGIGWFIDLIRIAVGGFPGAK